MKRRSGDGFTRILAHWRGLNAIILSHSNANSSSTSTLTGSMLYSWLDRTYVIFIAKGASSPFNNTTWEHLEMNLPPVHARLSKYGYQSLVRITQLVPMVRKLRILNSRASSDMVYTTVTAAQDLLELEDWKTEDEALYVVTEDDRLPRY
jgi:hypothetical protein